MSKFNSIIKGLNEAVQHEKGELKNVKVNRINIASLPSFEANQIKTIRMKKNLTQQLFARVLGVSLKTVEAWECGRNKPAGSAQRLLGMLEKDENLLEKNEIIILK